MKNIRFREVIDHLIENEKLTRDDISKDLNIDLKTHNNYTEKKKEVHEDHFKSLFEEYNHLLSNHTFME